MFLGLSQDKPLTKHLKIVNNKGMKHIAFKSLSVMTRSILLALILIMVFVGGFALRLAQGPIRLDFAKEYVETALNEQSAEMRLSMNSLMLEWSSYKNSLLLTLGDVRLYQGDENTEQEALEINKAMLGLSAPHLLTGKIKPSSVVIEGPILKFTIKDGEYDLFWSAPKEEEIGQQEQDEPPRDVRKRIAETLAEITSPVSGAFSHFSEMDEVVLRNAILKQVVLEEFDVSPDAIAEEILENIVDVVIDEVVSDVVPTEENYIALFDLALRRTNLGLEGNLDVQLPSEVGQKAQVKTFLTYRKEQKDITFDGKIFDINPSRFAFLFPEEPLLLQQNFVLDGSLQVAFDKNVKLQNASLNLSVPEGEINIPNEYEEPIAIKDANFNFSIHRAEKKVTLNNLSGLVGGIPLEIKSGGFFEKGHIHFPVTAKILEFKFEEVAKLLPKSAQGTSAAAWVENKLSKGRVFDVDLETQIDLRNNQDTGEKSFVIADPKINFKFEGLTVEYSDTLMPVEHAVGHGIYEKDSLMITGEAGDIGMVKGTNIDVALTDLSVAGGGLAKIKLHGHGPLSAVLNYISAEPIVLGKDETGIDPKLVSGDVSFDLDLQFPTLKDLPKEEVTVIIDGVINDTKLPSIVRSLDLTGGPYNLSFAKGKLGLKGKGQLSGRAIDLDYQQYLDPKGKDFETQVKAKIRADKDLRDVFGIGLEEYIRGSAPVDVTYTEHANGNANVKVKGTMAPATVTIEPFSYVKAQGIDGTFSLNAMLKDDVLTEINNFNLGTKEFSFDQARILFRPVGDEVEVARGEIKKMVLGRTMTKVDFEVTPDDVLKVVATGSVIDIAPFINKDKKRKKTWQDPNDKGGQAMKISLKAERAFTTKDQYLRTAQFYIETDKDADITRLEVDSKVGKAGDFYVRFKPENETGERTFRMESTDAGATLLAFDLYNDIAGGTMLVYGRPQTGNNKGDLFGTARLENFTVKNAPALARLLGAMSESGMQEVLKTKGVSFEKLESAFEWRFRDDGNLLVLKDGRTSGSSLGLTFEGVADMGLSTVDLNGTIIPLSGFNQAIGDIPLLGTLLTGGSKGGLFAATYTVSGPSKDPKVVVNPLSVLTPGFLRKILFEGDVESKLPENKAPIKKKAVSE